MSIPLSDPNSTPLKMMEFKFERWVLEVEWKSITGKATGSMYLDPIKGEILAPDGTLWARYNPEFDAFCFMLNGKMSDPIVEPGQARFMKLYKQYYQRLTAHIN